MSSAAGHPLAEDLRLEIERLHLTQKEVADDLGVSLRTMAYWLNAGATPQPRHRRAIISWLAESRQRELAA